MFPAITRPAYGPLRGSARWSIGGGSGIPAAARARTFVETARRAQIVAAAIDTIAEFGFAQASLARIAERLEISKGVILYHFDGKDDLVREVIAEVISTAEVYLRQRILAAHPGTGKLRAYIESHLGFMAEYRNPVVMAFAIRTGIDAVGARLARDPGLDIQHYGRELATLFEHATTART